MDERVPAEIRPGVPEIEIMAFIEHELRLRRHQGMIRMRRWNMEMHFGVVSCGPLRAPSVQLRRTRRPRSALSRGAARRRRAPPRGSRADPRRLRRRRRRLSRRSHPRVLDRRATRGSARGPRSVPFDSAHDRVDAETRRDSVRDPCAGHRCGERDALGARIHGMGLEPRGLRRPRHRPRSRRASRCWPRASTHRSSRGT